MRIIETKIYKFHELNELAKERVREWLRQLILSDPPWKAEHFGSLVQLCVQLDQIPDDEVFFADNLRSIIRQCKAYELTGYCADDVAIPLLEKAIANGFNKYDKGQFKQQCLAAYELEWKKEIRSMMRSSYVDEHIEANEYEFFEDGTLFRE